jgi:5-methylcytosine-specific restriction endonuclease McrA
MKNKLRHFTDEHKRKISESRKRLKANGWVPYNKGLKTLDRENGVELILKNMKAHLKYDVSLEWLSQFNDIEKLKYLNRSISRKRDCEGFTTKTYKQFIEKFYYDEKFNSLFDKWIESGDKWIKPSIDHIIPKSKGGTNELSNLQFLSWFENRCKNDMTQAEWDMLKANIKEYIL